jgi:hypothetical protein
MMPMPFCDRCADDITGKLAELPRMCVGLGRAIRDPTRRAALIRVPFGPSVPIRVDADALLRPIVLGLATWHDRVASGRANRTRVDLEHARLHALTCGPKIATRAVDVTRDRMAALFVLGDEPTTRPWPMPAGYLDDAIVTARTSDRVTVRLGGRHVYIRCDACDDAGMPTFYLDPPCWDDQSPPR